MTKLIPLALFTLVLTGCPTDWGKEAEKINRDADWEACHYMEEGEEKARPDGFPCKEAECSADGKSYWPRKVCSESGTRCIGPSEPIFCAEDEECMILEETPNGKQAVCAKK